MVTILVTIFATCDCIYNCKPEI